MAEYDVTTDRARSWIIAACCCFCNLTFYGVSRLSGIMLVAATQTFQVSRASAAVPFSLSTAIRNLAGVFVGHLGHRFGVGPVVASGCLIASLGAGLCFFAKDVQWLTVCWGGIFGFGFGLSTCLLPLAINQNFVKHNGAASGLSYSGSYIGSFIFPPIVVWLLNSYGLQGTFLVISGAVLNVLIAAMLLRERKTKKKYTLKRSYSGNLDNNHNKEFSSVWNSTEDGEMWKQNINREFLNSQCNVVAKSDKPNFIPNIYLSNPPPYLQREILLSENKSSVKHENSYHQEVPKKLLYLLPNLFEKFKHKKKNLENKDFKENSSVRITSFHTLSSACDKDSFSQNLSEYHAGYTEGIATKPVSIASKICLRKTLESPLLSRGKYKAKCKLKLEKLKKAIKTSLLKYRAQFGGQTDNVKLISFKYLQSFLYHYSYNQSMPNKCLNLTFPRSILYMPSENGENDNNKDFRKCITNAKGDYETSRTFCSAAVTRTKQDSVLPILDRLSEYSNTAVLNRNNAINSCDIFANGKNTTYLFQRTHESYNNSFPTNKYIDEDSSSNSTKTEDSQSSYIPNSSSEQSLHKMPESESKKGSVSGHSKSSGKVAKRCFADWFHMLREPMFTLIGFTMSIQTFMVVCVITTIEDYAKDVGIPENKTHYALMALSISNLIGTLTLGSITDRGYISRHRFLSLCFFGMSLSLVAVSLVAVSLPSLLSVVAVYGLLESGVIITFPILTKQFVKGERRQAVAIASSNVLSAPTVMLVPMLIGHFRDNIGCYSGLFHLLGATSFSCCLLWLIAPSLCQRRNQKKKSVQKAIISRC